MGCPTIWAHAPSIGTSDGTGERERHCISLYNICSPSLTYMFYLSLSILYIGDRDWLFHAISHSCGALRILSKSEVTRLILRGLFLLLSANVLFKDVELCLLGSLGM